MKNEKGLDNVISLLEKTAKKNAHMIEARKILGMVEIKPSHSKILVVTPIKFLDQLIFAAEGGEGPKEDVGRQLTMKDLREMTRGEVFIEDLEDGMQVVYDPTTEGILNDPVSDAVGKKIYGRAAIIWNWNMPTTGGKNEKSSG